MKIDILGTKYNIILDADIKDYPKLKDLNGYTDPSTKEIVVAKFIEDGFTVANGEDCIKKVLRHELVHAFLYESGLNGQSDWARNEEMVDWIALQFEKMLNVFIKTKAINEVNKWNIQ